MKMSTPPIVGVPAFCRCPCGSVLADVLPELALAQEGDELGLRKMQISRAAVPPKRIRPIQRCS